MNRIELVHWLDATSSDPWESLSIATNLKPHVIKTVGFLLDEDAERILLALNYDEDGEAVSQTIAIPCGWIIERLVFIEESV